MMGCLRIDHPDIETFIDAKREGGRLSNFNLSVLVTDAFMAALETGADWPLRFGGEVWRSVKAGDLWERLMRATYDAAEPGVVFIDRANAANNLGYCEEILGSNPCGEQMLPPYGACLLGSINLARLVDQPFEGGAALDEAQLAALTGAAVRMLDNAIDVSRFPLPEQEREAKSKRRIGLGVTGLADALLFCGARYGDVAAVDLTRRWLGVIKMEAYRTSANLAAEKGAFPLYDRHILERPNLSSLDDDVRALIAAHGLRNGCLTSIAPTGTTSLLAGNVSSGIEPVFAYAYTRKVRQADGPTREEAVQDHGLTVWKRLKGDEPPPQDLFVSAQNLTPADHLIMQAAAQAMVDSAVSKTVNCPESIAFQDFADIYRQGYRLGCKGLTTYRPNAVRGSVLSVVVTAPPSAEPKLSPRPERPFEVFVNSKNMEHYAWTLGLTRMISAVFRRGGDVSFVAEELKAVFDPRGGAGSAAATYPRCWRPSAG